MIHFIDKVLENLRAYIPLMQSLIWPIVVLIVIWVFRSHMRACISVIHKRIEAGGGLKIGPFELPPMAPATPQEQANNLEDKAAEEVTDHTTTDSSAPKQTSILNVQRDFKASYVLAEDLVMRKLSAELNLKIIRQVKPEHGVKYIFDGVALEEGRFIAVEVKMLRKVIHAKMIARKSLDRLSMYYTSLAEDVKHKFSLILAIVIDEGAPEDTMSQLAFIRDTYRFPVHIVCYRFKELQAEFGIK
ncbi:MAG: hypothetical protein MUO31_13550 [Thermodesulfovibrionales bacterium]|nr:hypothetical protein [Thermodesulfovibrionales bacterium]